MPGPKAAARRSFPTHQRPVALAPSSVWCDTLENPLTRHSAKGQVHAVYLPMFQGVSAMFWDFHLQPPPTTPFYRLLRRFVEDPTFYGYPEARPKSQPISIQDPHPLIKVVADWPPPHRYRPKHGLAYAHSSLGLRNASQLVIIEHGRALERVRNASRANRMPRLET